MKPYSDINGEFTQKQTLDKETEQLSDAKLKLQGKLNLWTKEFYTKEVARLTDIIELRRLYIKKLNITKEDTSGKVNFILNK